ncbi:hypothetical protein ACHAXS_007933 [Conticribra weissflogii]
MTQFARHVWYDPNVVTKEYKTTGEDRASTSYTRSELLCSRSNIIAGVRFFRAIHQTNDDMMLHLLAGGRCNDVHCIRGIEELVFPAMRHAAVATRTAVVNAVLKEQTVQNLRGVHDENRIAEASLSVSKYSRNKGMIVPLLSHSMVEEYEFNSLIAGDCRDVTKS